jgi:hypothetical protein
MQTQRFPAGLRRARLAGAVAVAMAALIGAPLATAAPRHDATPSPVILQLGGGSVLGGLTSQELPVMIEMRSPRRIAEAVTAIRLPCETGGFYTIADGWSDVRVSKRGRFAVEFGPEPEQQDDGTTVESEGTFSGRFNKSRTRASGTWSLKGTFRDAAGTVTDTCDSGPVDWTAKD